MAFIQYYMNYVFYTGDITLYQVALAMSGGTGLIKQQPRTLAAALGVPFPYPTGPIANIRSGINFIQPFTPGAQFFYPNASGVFVDDTALNTTVPGQNSVPAGSIGPDGLFTWSCNVIFSAAAGMALFPPATNIPQRRWICGRETDSSVQNPEAGNGVAVRNIGRDYSRTTEGFGFGIRSNNTTTWNRPLNDFFPITPTTSRERFYFRIRRPALATDTAFYYAKMGALSGWMFKITVGNHIDIYAVDTGGTQFKQGSVAIPVGGTAFTFENNKWYRVDAFIRTQSGPNAILLNLYLNGVQVFYGGIGSTFGGASHVNSNLGFGFVGSIDANLEMDFDDWINTDLPSNVSSTTLLFTDSNFSADWLLGSHVKAHYSKSISQVNWTPAGGGLGPTGSAIFQQLLNGTAVSTTSGATLEGLTDALTQAQSDSLAIVLGAVAAIQFLHSVNSLGTIGKLGYRLAGAAAVLTNITQNPGGSVIPVLYQPSGVAIPAEISPYSVTHTKSLDGATDTSLVMGTIVEYLGTFGVEDDPTWVFPIPQIGWLHNSHYNNTAWGYLGSSPLAPVFAVGGTYLGNGTYQEINLPAACHLLHIRALTGGGSGVKWYAASTLGYNGAAQGGNAGLRVYYDFDNNQFKFSVNGTNAEINANGVTFQYVAFCDPGMRFNYCGAFCHGSNITPPINNALVSAGFSADSGFAQFDSINTATTSWYRGPGSPANNASDLAANGQITTFGSFSPGVFTSLATLHSANIQLVNFSLWRTADSGGPGAGGCSNVMVQILQYIGNGVNPRNITLTPTSGRFPLYVLIVPVTGGAGQASFFRDPSHVAPNSARFDNLSNSTTAITAVAVDQITINAAVNTNGFIYSIFAICGDSAGMNNGTFSPNYCVGNGPYVAPVVPGGINLVSQGGIEFNGQPPLTMLKDVSGIYTLVPGKRNDTLLDRQTGQTSLDVEIPDPTFKTGYIGG